MKGWMGSGNTLTSLSPFFFLVWTDRDSTSLSNWSTCMFNVSIVFWRRNKGNVKTAAFVIHKKWNFFRFCEKLKDLKTSATGFKWKLLVVL